MRSRQGPAKPGPKVCRGYRRRRYRVLRLTLVEALPGKGFEPLQACAHSPLKAACLPVPPPGRATNIVAPGQPSNSTGAPAEWVPKRGIRTDTGEARATVGSGCGPREAPLATLDCGGDPAPLPHSICAR